MQFLLSFNHCGLGEGSEKESKLFTPPSYSVPRIEVLLAVCCSCVRLAHLNIMCNLRDSCSIIVV